MRDNLQQPVFITEHGAPTHVLLSIQDYQRLLQHQTSLSAALSSDDSLDLNFEKINFAAKHLIEY